MGRIINALDSIWRLSPQKIYWIITGKNKNTKYLSLLKKLEGYPRHTEGNINIDQMDIRFNDSAAFIYQFNEIFIKENYKYICNSDKPLIYDCGANIGMSVLYFKKIFPNALIKAFEPDPGIFKILSGNIEKNNLKQVSLFNQGIWNSNSVMVFGRDGADGGSFYKKGNSIEVKAVRLKELLDSEERISLLKLDIEGAELEVIKDCSESLAKCDNIFIEYHSFNRESQELDTILRLLKDNGFRYTLQQISEQISPFLSFGANRFMDLQINIYAKRDRAGK